MTNVIKKVRDNKMLSLFVLSLILICSFYGCKSIAAHADENNNSEASEIVSTGDEEAVEDSFDRNPNEAYGFKDDDGTLVLTYDTEKELHTGTDIYSIPEYATQANEWGWNEVRGSFTKVTIKENFKKFYKLLSTSYMFDSFSALQCAEGFENINTASTVNMSHMFKGCSSLTSLNLDLKFICTSNMGDMFSGCTQLSLDCSAWAVKADCYHQGFNYEASGVSLPDAWVPHPVAYAYKDGETLIMKYDIFKWKYEEFERKKVYEISTSATKEDDWQWNDDRETFKKVVIDESFKNYSGLTSTSYMFHNFKHVSEHEGFQNLNTENVKNMSHMFDSYGSSSGTLSTPPNVSQWNTSNVTDMSYMFKSYGQSSGCVSSTPDVSHWNTSNVTNMKWMFWMYGRNCIFQSLNLESFSMDKVTNYEKMLAFLRVKSIKLGPNINIEFGNPGACLTNSSDDWNRTWYSQDGVECPQCTIPPREFTTTYYDTVLVPYGYREGNKLTITYDTEMNIHENQGQEIYDLRHEKGIGTWSWYHDREEITEVTIKDDFRNFHGLTSTGWMFYKLYNVNKLEGCENIDTSHVTNMTQMFDRFGSDSLTMPPNVANWNTSNATNMSYMFLSYGGSSLCRMPDVSRWDTSRVTNTRSMFENYGEDRVFNLDLSNWDTSNITDRKNYDNMLCDCRLWSITLGEKFDLVLGADWEWEHSACICDTGKGRSNEWHDVYGNWYSPKYFGKEKRTAPKTYYDIYTRTTSIQKNLKFSCTDKSQDSINKKENVNVQNYGLNKSQIKQDDPCKGNIEAKVNSLDKRRQKVSTKYYSKNKPIYTDNKAKDNSLYKRRQTISNIKI